MNDTKCNRPTCQCTHTQGCVKGFVSVRYLHTKKIMVKGKLQKIEQWYDGVQFCPVCDPERAHIQATSQSSEEMADRLRNRSQFKASENYERQEASKTRTL